MRTWPTAAAPLLWFVRCFSTLLILRAVHNNNNDDAISVVEAFSSHALVPSRASSSTTTRAGLLDDALERVREEIERPRVRAPPGFAPPEPRPLALTGSADLADVLRSAFAFVLRLGTGAFVLGWRVDDLFHKGVGDYSLPLGPLRVRDSSSVLATAPRPAAPLVLYEYAASPYCARVRETINLLDLTVEYRPCPGARQGAFSDDMYARTGRRTVPWLVDPNTGEDLFESGDIVAYLLETYGPTDRSTYDAKALWPISFEPFSVITSALAAAARGLPGSTRRPDARPDNERMRPLELWGYECSPFVRPVRETLCELCLPHVMVSCARGSANRDRLVAATGARFQVPFLRDPNTGIEMFEGPEIVEYLENVYTMDN